MFARLFAVASLAVLAVAAPTPLDVRDQSQCDTGAIECRNTFQQANDASSPLSLFGLAEVLADVTGQTFGVLTMGASSSRSRLKRKLGGGGKFSSRDGVNESGAGGGGTIGSGP